MVNMNNQTIEPQDQFVMETPTQWKAFSHPLRLRILKQLVEEAHTNEELATALGEKSGKLYFHTKRLLDAGLIVLEGTRQKGPNTEKFYRAVARRFTASTPVQDGATPHLERLLGSALQLYRSAWHESSGSIQQSEFGFHLVVPIDSLRRAEFVERLKTLQSDFRTSSSRVTDAQSVALTVLMYSLDSREDAEKAPATGNAGSADTGATERNISS